MRPEELIIGDWVCYSKANKYYTRVNEIRHTEVPLDDQWYIEGMRSDNDKINPNAVEYFAVEILSPIPLTAEILEKNGFIIKEKWAQIGNFGDSPLIMWHFVDDPILGDYSTELEVHQNDTGKVHVHIPCEYVHQLQHALRLCGINKEITI